MKQVGERTQCQERRSSRGAVCRNSMTRLRYTNPLGLFNQVAQRRRKSLSK